ncbi:MAG TPA: class I SAM-dependent methyltransferase [Kofleriaceae bacterium]
MISEAKQCRICGNTELISIVNLGEQSLTGVFPKTRDEQITSGPLELVKCSGGDSVCGLVQLRQSYDLQEMYGLNYGYRSGLNRSMVEHLRDLVRQICAVADPKAGDLVIDIGSNDSTLLQAYPKDGPTLVGIDPTGVKFKQYYPDHISLIPDFFSAAAVNTHLGARKAKVISSIAMFYDLESPIDFMHQIREVLADDGVWLFEQSYMPTMLDVNAYDTICHEHLEYYGLAQIKWMTDRAGFKIIDVALNNVNGGSFAVMVAKTDSRYPEATAKIAALLRDEATRGLHTLAPYHEFKTRIFEHRDQLLDFVAKAKQDQALLLGYGASTKGNVILQFCKLSAADIPSIAEVNEEKFGCYTPGTLIPIVSEREARALKPAYFLVLPWHFKQTIIERERDYLMGGGKLVFPLPTIEAVGR